MSKWLQAAHNTPLTNDKTDVTDKTQSKVLENLGDKTKGCVSSVLSVLSPTSENPQKSNASVCEISDEEAYAAALRTEGPCGYGVIAQVLGWGATRAGQAEASLNKQGRLAYDRTGRGWLIEHGGKAKKEGQQK